MTWDDHLQQYREAEAAGDRSRAWQILEDARKLVGDRAQRDWLIGALEDVDRRWFVAAVFARQPIPAALREPMLRGALLDPVDASAVRAFIVPLGETFGVEDIAGRLKALAELSPGLARAAGKAAYWLGSVKKTRSKGRARRKIVVDGEPYEWCLRDNSIDKREEQHIAVYAAATNRQTLYLDPYVWEFEIRPRTVADAIRFALGIGWTPKSPGPPIYLGFRGEQFFRLPDGVRFGYQLQKK
jgi:hypothetical protein